MEQLIKIKDIFQSYLTNSNEARYTLIVDIKFSFDLIDFLKFENTSPIYAKDDKLKCLHPNCGIFLKRVKMRDHVAAHILVILAKIK